MASISKKMARFSSGNTIVEFAPAIYVVFVMITFPMIAFGWAGVRYSILANAANLAAQQASKARCFNTDIPAASGSPAHLSAVHTAQNVAAQTVNGMGAGAVTLAANGVATYIKIRPISGATTAPAQPAVNTPLSANLLNPTLYTYTCEVLVTGTIAPLFPHWEGLAFVQIPLLNKSITSTARADYTFENNLNLSI